MTVQRVERPKRHRERRFTGPLPDGKLQQLRDPYVRVKGARPSLLTGIASLWDFHGLMVPTLEIRRDITTRLDGEALASAWATVADNLLNVMPPSDDSASFHEKQPAHEQYRQAD